MLERKRLFEERKRRAAGARDVAEPIACATCGVSTIRNSGSAKYCEPCAAERAAVVMRESRLRYEASHPPRVREPEGVKRRQARYLERNPEKRAAAVRAYNDANRETINAKARERNRTEKRRAYIRKWERRKAANDPRFVLNGRMKQALRGSLKGEKRGRRWEHLVGYTVEELRVHLERQFVKGMSWEDMREWHIDHVLPLSSFTFETPNDPNFRAAWALTNLRPLWATANLRKGATRTHLL